MMALLTADNDIQLTINGFKLFGQDDNGTEWHTSLQDVTGLFDGAGTNLATEDLVWTDGLFSNIPTRGGKSIAIRGHIMGNCSDTLILSWEKLKGALRVDDQLLEIKLGNISRQVTVKQSSGAPLIKWAGPTMMEFSFGLEMLTPYLLAGGDPTQGSTLLAKSTGGMIFPESGYTFETPDGPSEWVFGEQIVAGAVNLTSRGNSPSPVRIRIDGPVTNPEVTHSPSGKVLSFAVTLGAGSYITADSGTREIQINGLPPVNGVVSTRQWFSATPGQNTFRFASKSADDGALLTVSFREAYI